jgi:hypothetical protein
VAIYHAGCRDILAVLPSGNYQLFCPDGLDFGSVPYLKAHLQPKIVTSLNDIVPSQTILFSWSYSWQDIGWFNKVPNPIVVGGKHAELLAIHNKLPYFPHVKYWTQRLDAIEWPLGTHIIPDYESFMPVNRYKEWLMVHSGEGCYWRQCTFCNVDYPVPYIEFEPDWVAKAILEANKYGKIAGLSGETHTVPWLEELESYLPEGRRYDTYTRADQNGWNRLSKAHKIFIGLEYLSDSVLQRVRKGVTAKQIIETICEIQALGISVESTVIIDLWQTADEREEHHQNTMNLLRRTRRAGLRAGTFTLMETQYTPINKNHYIIMDGEVIR